MLKNCSGLKGQLPTINASLSDGISMFEGATQLSGTCPAHKPGRRMKMYSNTNVTCSYGK